MGLERDHDIRSTSSDFNSIVFRFQDSLNDSYIDRIYRVNPLLCYTKQPLKMPLLSLPYGHSLSASKLLIIVYDLVKTIQLLRNQLNTDFLTFQKVSVSQPKQWLQVLKS